MPKYLLLKHYRGGPEPHHPSRRWTSGRPRTWRRTWPSSGISGRCSEENGEYVAAQALTQERTWVRYGGPDAAPVTTDGPLPETSDLIAGWYMVDVESHERALELAALRLLRARPRRRAAARVDRRAGGHVRGAVPGLTRR